MSGNQSISAIGSYGLESGGIYNPYNFGATSMNNYFSPNQMLSGYGAGFMNPMMNMYGGSFINQQMEAMKELYKYQEELEKRKLEHATEMHKKNQLAEVANLSSHDQAFFLKAMEDGYVQQGIREIYDAIRSGNTDYAVQKFYELKQGILNKFSDHFKDSAGNINSKENINNYIRILYSEIAGSYSPGAPKPDLINDIKAFGETPFMHGFNKMWLGNSGHNKLNAEEALNQMFGTGINDRGSKKNAEKMGEWASRGSEALAFGAAGSVAGMTALGAVKVLTPEFITKHIPTAVATNSFAKWGTKFKTWGKAGFLALAIGDILWQMSRS